MEIFNDIKSIFVPEIIICLGIFVLLLLGAFKVKNKWDKYIASTISVLTLCSGIFFSLVQVTKEQYWGFNYSFFSSPYTITFKICILLSAIVAIFLSISFLRSNGKKIFEYFSLYLGAVFGAMTLISSNDFLTMVVSLEILSVCCYFLVAMFRGTKAKEAGLKYFFTGALAFALIIMGISYIWGVGGSLNFNELSENLSKMEFNTILILGEVLLFCGLAYKVGVAPFMNWISDVYEGSNLPLASFLSSVPKIAGIGILMKLSWFLVSQNGIMHIILVLMAVITLILSNLAALRQENIKRFLAYSSISHFGFMLLGISVLTSEAYSAVTFYLICYLVMNFALFAGFIIFYLKTDKTNLCDLRGLVYTQPLFVALLSVAALSLSGMPISIGFVSKFYLFIQVMSGENWFVYPLIAALATTVIGVVYYFNIVFLSIKKAEASNFKDKPLLIEYSVFIISTLLIIVLSFTCGPIIEKCINLFT